MPPEYLQLQENSLMMTVRRRGQKEWRQRLQKPGTPIAQFATGVRQKSPKQMSAMVTSNHLIIGEIPPKKE